MRHSRLSFTLVKEPCCVAFHSLTDLSVVRLWICALLGSLEPDMLICRGCNVHAILIHPCALWNLVSCVPVWQIPQPTSPLGSNRMACVTPIAITQGNGLRSRVLKVIEILGKERRAFKGVLRATAISGQGEGQEIGQMPIARGRPHLPSRPPTKFTCHHSPLAPTS